MKKFTDKQTLCICNISDHIKDGEVLFNESHTSATIKGSHTAVDEAIIINEELGKHNLVVVVKSAEILIIKPRD